MTIEQKLMEAVKRAAGKLPKGVVVTLDAPERSEQGDYATSLALQLAKPLKQPPLEIAKIIGERLGKDAEVKDVIGRVEVAPPGFVNIFLRDEWYAEQTLEIAQDWSTWFRQAEAETKQKVQVEFISANPTGPLTLANGRGGFLGDTIARVLESAGHDVTREYYVNDSGEQVKKLGASVLKQWGIDAGYGDEELYPGAYVEELAEQLEGFKPKEADDIEAALETVSREASKAILKRIKHVVTKDAHIPMDVWYSEKSLMRRGAVEESIKALKRKKLVEEREGALWLKLSALDEKSDKDKVVVKSNGEPAYVLPDIAYHYDKFIERKFDRVIDIFGADHQGHAKALTTALEALGIQTPEILITQMVRLLEDGKERKMSKRAGTYVELKWLLDEIGSDVARWFFIERTPDTHMSFDLSLAKDTSEKNPVFYVQYSHARCSSILRKAEQAGRASKAGKVRIDHPSERALARELTKLPDLVLKTSETLEVHHLPTYATFVAKAFSAFYRDCPVLDQDKETTTSRLALVTATKAVLSSTLGLMGIRAPERM